MVSMRPVSSHIASVQGSAAYVRSLYDGAVLISVIVFFSLLLVPALWSLLVASLHPSFLPSLSL